MRSDITYLLDKVAGLAIPSGDKEILSDCIGFVQGFHDLLKDYGMLSNTDVDVAKLEAAYEAILGENAAASIYLASRDPKAPKVLMDTHNDLIGNDGAPAIVVNGYKNLSKRVENTRKKLSE